MSRDSVLGQWRRLPHPIRWIGVATVGGTLIGVGVILLVLPGPGLVLIALGVAVLATEFAWAETVLQRMKRTGSAAAEGARRAISKRRGEPAPPSADESA
jgi:uncharacterized protein (TIGR02611 family)